MSGAKRIWWSNSGRLKSMTWIATALFAVAMSQHAIAAESADLVRQAAEGWTQGAVKQDAAALHRFLADDLQYAHAGGNTQTKEQYIAAVMKGPPRYESFTFSDLNIRFYAKAAV